jgi:hypothetical protein
LAVRAPWGVKIDQPKVVRARYLILPYFPVEGGHVEGVSEHGVCQFCAFYQPYAIDTGKQNSKPYTKPTGLVRKEKVPSLEMNYRGGLGKLVLPGRKSFSKSEMRKNREETPAYLHGSWEYVGREPRFSRSPVFEIALFFTRYSRL